MGMEIVVIGLPLAWCVGGLYTVGKITADPDWELASKGYPKGAQRFALIYAFLAWPFVLGAVSDK